LRAATGGELDPFDRVLLAARIEAASNGDLSSSLLQTAVAAKIDLHPHQLEAALFALTRPPGQGALLADEVGLGKTIEAGLVIAESIARGAERVLILVPASLRVQWKSELERFFDLPSRLIDGPYLRREGERFRADGVHIASLAFFAGPGNPPEFREADWDLVVIDEAHRLRNVYQPGAKRARRLRELLRDRRLVLLSATPVQNSLMELFGLVSFIDRKLLGSEGYFRSRFLEDDRGLAAANVDDLRGRLDEIAIRTLRRQVRDHIRFTRRTSALFDFEPTPGERELYVRLSDYLRRARAVQLLYGSRELFVLMCRKILASSTFAIAATLRRLGLTLAERLAGRMRPSRLGDDLDGFAEEREELGEGSPAEELPREVVESEIAELRTYATLAESISVNAKGERLVAALEALFIRARERRWPDKVVIFTESRRTQEYLARRLAAAGWSGDVTVLNGASGDAHARDSLVREFRDRTRILLSTEVGAEGLNLQFCNIVVNYATS